MKVSIITTIYKAEKDLPRLLDSMMALKSPELEFFLIDNGSPDRCGEICAEYAKKDSRFFLRTLKANIGYIRARMLGIQECDADYVAFCDSDDYLEPGGYDHAIQTIKEQNCDLYITSHNVHWENGMQMIYPPYEKGLYQGDGIKRTIMPQAYGFINGRDRVHGFMWKQIYRRGIIINAGITLIEELKPWEDQVFNIDVIQHSNRIYIDDQVIYNYFANSGSITSKMIKDFDCEDYWSKTRRLFIEKSQRATDVIERRASANAGIYNVYTLVVTLCKSSLLTTSSVASMLKSLFKKDDIFKQMVEYSADEDLAKQLRLVKYSLRYGLYHFLAIFTRYKLKKANKFN